MDWFFNSFLPKFTAGACFLAVLYFGIHLIVAIQMGWLP